MNHRSGSEQIAYTGQRLLKEIIVNYIPSHDKKNPILIKKYTFEYAYGRRTSHSLLTRIIETGSDGEEMPPITFNYQDIVEPSYQVYSILGDPTIGNNLWNIKVDGEVRDLYLSTDKIFPWGDYYYGGINWGKNYTLTSGSDNSLSWDIGPNGDLSIRGGKNTAFYESEGSDLNFRSYLSYGFI